VNGKWTPAECQAQGHTPGDHLESYRTMTVGGMTGASYLAETGDAAREMATRDGYVVLDVLDGPILVIE